MVNIVSGELIPELQNGNAQLRVFSGEKNFTDSSDVVEKEGKWFFAPLASLGINKCARESGFHRANVVRKLVRGLPIKRVSYTEFVGWLRRYELEAPNARMRT
jgi:hypothetical protein